MTKNLWGLKLQIDLRRLWLQQLSKGTVKPQRCRLILQDHQHLLQRKKHPSSPQDIRPLPKDGHRKSECKQAEENCQFD